MRHFTRLTNGFSKKFENHVWMVALYTDYYNWIKVHKSLRVPPATEAGLSKQVCTFEDLAMLVDERTRKPGKREPTKSSTAAK